MKILLANDSSKHSQAAANYLRALRFRKPIELEIVSAVAAPIIVESDAMGMPDDLSMFITEECESAQARVDQAATEFDDSTRSVQTRVPVGPPSTELLLAAEQSDADLIVLGAVGHSAMERVLLGSVSDYVATHADTSTLVVRPPRESSLQPELSKILIALSGSPEDQRMIDWLRDLKLPANVEVHLLRILELQTFYRQDIRQKASEFWKSFVNGAQIQILEFETTLQQMGLNTETHLVESDHIGEALIEYAEHHGCDLIMTGDSDSGLLTRVFMGSTSRYVLRHARCSVLIVRDKEDRQTAKEQAAAKAKTPMIV